MITKSSPATLPSQPGALVSNNNARIECSRAAVNYRAPSAWLVAPGVVRLQIHEPRLAESLKKVRGWKLVAFGVLGGYLRVFQFQRPLAWALRWIARHTSANEAFSQPEDRQSGFLSADGVTQGEAL